MTDAGQLLRAYVAENSEDAFRGLVDTHIGLVYSTALRVVHGDTALASDVTQIVFTDLARKAQTLPKDVVLSGWLYRHTTFTASKVVRGESRRRVREQEAANMNPHNEADAIWDRLTPLLDGAMASLSGRDRDAVVMRYFERRDYRSVAANLKMSEDAAQKRVSRALEKLRTYFERRGIAVSGTTLGALMTAHAVSAVPSTLAGAVAGNALVHVGAAATPFLISLLMAKIKSIAVGAAVIAAVGTPLVLQQQSIARLRAENQQLKQEQPGPTQVEVRTVAPPVDNREVLQLRAEVARLRREHSEMTRGEAQTKLTPV
jgi:RNA polymerase sigma factor (sigma-70 family)